MGDYEVHRLVVRADDDLVGILNNIGSNTEVILREGTHAWASQVHLSGLTNVTIRGSKASILNITYTDGVNPACLITAPTADISFEGFSLVYNGTGGTTTPVFQPTGVGGADHYRLTFRSIHAEFVSGAVTLIRPNFPDADIYGLLVEGCSLYGAATKGFLRFDQSNARDTKQVRVLNNNVTRDTVGGSTMFSIFNTGAGVFEDIVIAQNAFYGINEHLYISNSATGTFRKFVITANAFSDGNGSDGCIVIGTGGVIENFVISNNTFDKTGNGECLQVMDGIYMTISDNEFIDSVGPGLRIGADVEHSTIDDNVASNCGAEGFEINGSNNRIANNVAEGNDYGIWEDSGADGNHYVGNTCRNNLTADKLLQGSGRRQGVNFW